MTDWESKFEEEVAWRLAAAKPDPAHDLSHIRRVVRTAKRLAEHEGAQLRVVIPAAWLHDLVIVPKNDPQRSRASLLSAEAASEFLTAIGYEENLIPQIAHAVVAHSFSANIEPETLEAKVVQDADRLDGIGAIGIARCFTVGGTLSRVLYSEVDPFCEERAPDDRTHTVDHFYAKLFRTAESMRTEAGRKEGKRRAEIMRRYLADLASELGQ